MRRNGGKKRISRQAGCRKRPDLPSRAWPVGDFDWIAFHREFLLADDSGIALSGQKDDPNLPDRESAEFLVADVVRNDGKHKELTGRRDPLVRGDAPGSSPAGFRDGE